MEVKATALGYGRFFNFAVITAYISLQCQVWRFRRKPAQVGETLIDILEAFPSYRDCGVFSNN